VERWWTDPDQAATVLTFVDDSDVVHGVSTAFLGYHGLAEGVLRPLAQRTLVDGEVISEALQDVDLEPVAKALGEATRPVLGEESAAYGQLLAKQFHEDAVESTTRFVTNLVSTGMPWPTAVERAASVHGVPVQRLGKAGSQLRAPVVAKASAADVADRALMEFAAHVGIREDARDVVSKMEREREFDENDVNRDQNGRFAPKASSSLSGMSQEMINQDRQKRMERMRRRRERQQQQLKRIDASKKSLSQLKREGKVQGREQSTARGVTNTGEVVTDAADKVAVSSMDLSTRKILDQAQASMASRFIENVRERVVQAAVDDFVKNRNNAPNMDSIDSLRGISDVNRRDEDGYYPGYLVGSTRGEQKYLLINRHLMNEIVDADGFNWQKLVASGATNGLEPETKDELRLAVDQISSRFNDDDDLEDFAVLAFDGPIAYSESYTEGKEEIPAPASNYYVQLSDDSGIGDTLDLGLKVRESPGSSHRMNYDMPFVKVWLENDQDFRNITQKMWNEAEVNRDTQGRFSDKPGGSGQQGRLREVDPDKAARQARLKARRERQQKQMRQIQAQRSVTAQQLKRQSRERQTARENPTLSSLQRDITAEPVKAVEAQMANPAEVMMGRFMEQAQKKMVQQAIARNEKRMYDFKARHQASNEDLKFTQAVVFDPEEDIQLLNGMFAYDPANREPVEELRNDDPAFRANAFEYGKNPIPASSAASVLHNRAVKSQERGDRRFMADDPVPVTMPDGNPILTNLSEAYSLATSEADNKNRTINSSVERFVGFAQRRTDLSDGNRVVYEPMVAPIPIEETDIVVLGNDDDWIAARQGENVTLQPVAGFDDEPDRPGLGSFDHLFGEIADDEEWQRQMQSPVRSDFYVRAFRIKR